MSGVDGAIKINSSLAPKAKISEAKVVVSEVCVVEKQKELKPIIEQKIPEVIEEITEEVEIAQAEEIAETELEEQLEEIVETKSEEPPVQEEKQEKEEEPLNTYEPVKEALAVKEKKSKKEVKNTLKQDFEILENLIKKMYDEVFSKFVGFNPSFEQTVGDVLLYLSSKLRRKNLNLSFDNEFSLNEVEISAKYDANYMPLVLQLSTWCEKKNKLKFSEEILSQITYLYINACALQGIKITELEIAIEFEKEIEYSILE